jgi:hypothetical protein
VTTEPEIITGPQEWCEAGRAQLYTRACHLEVALAIVCSHLEHREQALEALGMPRSGVVTDRLEKCQELLERRPYQPPREKAA